MDQLILLHLPPVLSTFPPPSELSLAVRSLGVSMDLEQMIKHNPNDAKFDNERKHRFLLWRTLDPNKPNKDFVNFVLLNPSTADEEKPDPTLKKCISFAKQNDYEGVIITNLFSYRTPYPRKLYEQNKRNRNLPESDAWIESAAINIYFV